MTVFKQSQFICERDIIVDTIDALDYAAPIVWNPDFNVSSTKIYQAAAATNSAHLFTSGPNLYNRHPYGILPSAYRSSAELMATFGPFVATTVDVQGVEFVSFIESPQFPIYGAATHPEKVMWEWRSNVNNPKTSEAMHANIVWARLLGALIVLHFCIIICI